jgi:hypothetical protein
MPVLLTKAKNYARNRDNARGHGAQCVRCAKTVAEPTVGVYANDAGNEILTVDEARANGFESLWAVGPECQKVPELRGVLVDFYAPPVSRKCRV